MVNQCKQNKLELKVNTLDCLPVKKSLSAKQQVHPHVLLSIYFFIFLFFFYSTACYHLSVYQGVVSFSLVAQPLPGA